MKTLITLKLASLFFVLTLVMASGSVNLAQENTPLLFKITELKNGLKLRYSLYLPRQFSPSESYPLAVALHYGGKVTPFFSKDFMTSLVAPALQDLGAIIVAPDCPAREWTNSVSEAAVLELILIVMEEYNIDPDRILILGYSMGGLGTWYMAARHPDLFSAAIPISAPGNLDSMPVLKDVPLYIIHGEQDELFSFAGVKKLYQKQEAAGAEIELKIIKGASHNQLHRFITPLKATIPWIRKVWEER